MKRISKFRSLSQRVFDRRRARTLSRIRGFLWLGVMLCFLAMSYFMFRNSQRAYLAVNAPTWADFRVMSSGITDLREQVASTNIEGLPYRLTINGEIWDVSKVDHFSDSESQPKDGSLFAGFQAQTYCSKHLIVYIQHNDPQLLRVSLWHEVMHAGACLHGGDGYWNSINPTKTSHEGVRHLGEFLATFTRDNPLFVQWASAGGSGYMFAGQ